MLWQTRFRLKDERGLSTLGIGKLFHIETEGFMWFESKRSFSLRPWCAIHRAVFLVLPVLMLATASAQVAVSTVTSSSGRFTSVSNVFTFAHTTSTTGANELLLVGVSINVTNKTITEGVASMTYGGTSLAQLGSIEDNANNVKMEMWYLYAPPTGTNNVVINLTVSAGKTDGVVAGAITFTGVDKTTPLGTFASAQGNSNTPSVSVATASNELVVDTLSIVANKTASAGTGQTEQWNTTSISGTATGQDVLGSGSIKTGSGTGTTTMSWNLSGNTKWALGAISIKPAKADLSITKSASGTDIPQGTQYTYTLTVTNNGPSQSTNITTTDTLATHLQYQSAGSSAGCSASGQTITCTSAGPLNSGSTTSFTIAVIYDASVVLDASTPSPTNTATVSESEIDTVSGNNTSNTVTTNIIYATFVDIFDANVVKNPQGATQLHWKTGSEVRNLGFNVYREQGGTRVRLNPSLIAGSALTIRGSRPGHGTRSYQWTLKDEIGGAGNYWLEAVDVSGHGTWHGPMRSSGDMPLFASPGRADSSTVAESRQNRTGTQNNVHTAPRASGELAMLRARVVDIQNWLAQQEALKIYVRQEGWYRVTQPQLAAAGFNTSGDPNSWRLFVDGVEQSVLVVQRSPGVFGPNDILEFYGLGQDTPFTDERVYWLLHGEVARQRVTPGPMDNPSNVACCNFDYTVELRERTTYIAALLNGKENKFFGDPVTSSGLNLLINAPVTNDATQTLRTPHADASSVSSALLEITLQGAIDRTPHGVTVQFGGDTLGKIEFFGLEQGRGAFTLPMNVLTGGPLSISLQSDNDSNDISLVDTIRLTYKHTFTPDSDSFRFNADAGSGITLNGFSNADVRVFDVTTPTSPMALAVQVQKQENAYSVSFTVPVALRMGRQVISGQHVLLAVSDAGVAVPDAVSLHSASTLLSAQNQADMIVLGSAAFLPGAQSLIGLHTGQGMKVQAVALEDVYDTFNLGEKSPYAIKAFLQYAYENWKSKPQYLLLLGDASMDPRNYLGFGYLDYMPTRIIDTSQIATATDDWFTDFYDAGLPLISTGRLPVHSAEEALMVANRLAEYSTNPEPGAWMQQALLVADVNDIYNFDGFNATLALQLSSRLSPVLVSTTQQGASTARNNILTTLNSGSLFVNYTGHGSEEIWSEADLFNAGDASMLQNGTRLPVFTIMSCLNGLFQDVFTTSLAESLMLAPNGGAAAVWASSGLTGGHQQQVMNQAFVRSLFSGSNTPFGDAARSAKSTIDDMDVRRTWILFGDPAMALPTAVAPSSSVPQSRRAIRLQHH